MFRIFDSPFSRPIDYYDTIKSVVEQLIQKRLSELVHLLNV